MLTWAWSRNQFRCYSHDSGWDDGLEYFLFCFTFTSLFFPKAINPNRMVSASQGDDHWSTLEVRHYSLSHQHNAFYLSGTIDEWHQTAHKALFSHVHATWNMFCFYFSYILIGILQIWVYINIIYLFLFKKSIVVCTHKPLQWICLQNIIV